MQRTNAAAQVRASGRIWRATQAIGRREVPGPGRALRSSLKSPLRPSPQMRPDRPVPFMACHARMFTAPSWTRCSCSCASGRPIGLVGEALERPSARAHVGGHRQWAHVREQSAIAALCALSVTKPLRIRCALLGTKAWVVGFAADVSWLVYFTALRKAPVAVVQSVAESGV